MSSEPTAFVVDDDESVRTGIEILLKSVGIKVETYASGVAFLESYDPFQPGCLIVDVRMPEISGLELQKKLNMLDYTIPVIIVTGYGNVPMSVQAMVEGAVVFLEKPLEEQALLESVQKAFSMDAQARKEWTEQAAIKERLGRLSQREREVLNLVVTGRGNKTIAYELGISEKTIDFHRANIKKKLDIDSVAELVRIVGASKP
ncbi:response regulator transcription factor [Planctomycetota bacterium]